MVGEDGDANGEIGIIRQKRFRKAEGLLAEDQKISFLELGTGVAAFCFFGKKPAAVLWKSFPKFSERIPATQRNLVPIIESSPFEVFVVNGKTERLN